MASEPGSGDQYVIRIGRDASGPVVAGHDIRVEVHRAAEAPAEPEAPDTMNNTANDHATAYTVMNGELHVHQAEATEPPQGE
ncbi:hypothetical protein [Streptomyces sp. NPDC090445]|uniref:hypothetical protein n=1 Tax=Streptomyces sp. NPDC090445 TaxID=3365963 RepID=UPI003817EB91